MVQKFKFLFSISRKWLKTRQSNFFSSKCNFFIAYELDIGSRDLDANFFLKDHLFGGATLTKKPDPDKYFYSRYGIGFDSAHFFYIQILIGVTMLLFLD